MRDDLQRVSDALDVPLRWLVWLALLGFVTLIAAVVTRDAPVGFVAAAFGVVISLIGVRAAIRPSRPFRLESFDNSPSINTTRAVGHFYVAAGAVWAALAVMAAFGA